SVSTCNSRRPTADIRRLLAGLRWDISKNFHTSLDWEGVYWNLSGGHNLSSAGAGSSHPTEHYITLGTGYNLTNNTLLKLNYTFGTMDGLGALTSAGGSKVNVNTFVGQVAVKF
ncbi:MAG: hypothetical protein ABJA67_15265, partial [Chthonomonadales bacterium]